MFECGWTLEDIRGCTWEELRAVSKILERWALLKEPINEEQAGDIVKRSPELASTINRKLEEQEKLFGGG